MKNFGLLIAALIATTALGTPTKSQVSNTREQLHGTIRERTKKEDSKWRSYGDRCQVNWKSWKKVETLGIRYAKMRNTPHDLLDPNNLIYNSPTIRCAGSVTVDCKTLKIKFSLGGPSFERPRPGDWEETLLLDICSTLPASERAI